MLGRSAIIYPIYGPLTRSMIPDQQLWKPNFIYPPITAASADNEKLCTTCSNIFEKWIKEQANPPGCCKALKARGTALIMEPTWPEMPSTHSDASSATNSSVAAGKSGQPWKAFSPDIAAESWLALRVTGSPTLKRSNIWSAARTWTWPTCSHASSAAVS